MATVALGIIADNTVLFTFGKEPRGFVMPWASGSVPIAGLNVSTLQILIPVVGLALAAGLHLFSRRTRLGKAMLAVVLFLLVGFVVSTLYARWALKRLVPDT